MRIGMLCGLVALFIFSTSLISCTSRQFTPHQLSIPVAFSFNWSGVSPDVKRNSWLWTEKFMQRMIDRKLLTENDLEYPYKSLSRAEFLHWMIRDVKEDTITIEHPFLDIDADHPYHTAILLAFQQGIIESHHYFFPEQPLLRSELAKWLIRAKGGAPLEEHALSLTEPLIPAQDGYAVVPRDSQGYLSLCLVPEHQLMYYRWKSGSEFRYIEANRPISKAEAAFSLYHLRFPPKKDSSLIVGYYHGKEQPYRLDHALSKQSPFSDMLFSPVIGGRDEQWSYFPLLIQQIPSLENGLWKLHDDGSMEVTFHFRNNLRWSDGTPLNAHDAVHAHQLKLSSALSPNEAEMLSSLHKVEAIDDMTFKTWWKRPYPYANLYIEVFPALYAKTKSLSHADYLLKPLHAGPYALSSTEGKKLTFHANSEYLFGPPLLDTVTLISFDCNEALYEAWQNQTLHMAFYNFSSSLKQNKDFILQPTLRWEHLGLSTDHPFLADYAVRQALMYSLNRKQITQELFSASYPLAHSFFPSDHPSFSEEKIKRYPYDLNQASRMMDEAGWSIDPESQLRKKNDQSFVINLISIRDDHQREKILKNIATDWAKLHIKVEIITEEPEHFFSTTLSKRDFQGAAALLYSWNFRPESNLFTLLHSTMIPSKENGFKGQNYSSFRHAHIDEILLDNFRQVDSLRINQNLGVILELMSEELPSLPLFFHPITLSPDQNLEQTILSSPSEHTMQNIAWWYRK